MSWFRHGHTFGPYLFVSSRHRILSAAQDTPGKQGAPCKSAGCYALQLLPPPGRTAQRRRLSQAQARLAAIGRRACDRVLCGRWAGHLPSRLDEQTAVGANQGHFMLENRGGAGGTIGASRMRKPRRTARRCLHHLVVRDRAGALLEIAVRSIQFTTMSLIAEVPIVLGDARQQSDQDARGVHRQGQGRARQDHVRQRRCRPGNRPVGRVAQDPRRHRPAARAVRGMAPGMAASTPATWTRRLFDHGCSRRPATAALACSASARPSDCPKCRTCRRSPSWCRAIRWQSYGGCSLRPACRRAIVSGPIGSRRDPEAPPIVERQPPALK